MTRDVLTSHSFAAQDEPPTIEGFFPIPVRFRHQGQIKTGWLEEYVKEPGRFFPTKLKAVIRPDGCDYMLPPIPVGDIIDE